MSMIVASSFISMTVGMFSLAGSRLSHSVHSRTISLSAPRLAASTGNPYGQAFVGNDQGHEPDAATIMRLGFDRVVAPDISAAPPAQVRALVQPREGGAYCLGLEVVSIGESRYPRLRS